MGARGPLPKDAESRQRRNATVEMTELGTSQVAAPRLPGSSKFVKSTRDWYAVWCSSPQASQFTVTDWLRLHMLAPLVDAYYRAPEKGLLAEIRANEKELGATPEARQRLKWRVGARQPGVAESSSSARAKQPSRRRKDPRLKLVEGGRK